MVSRLFRSKPYSPFHRKVSPGTVSRPARSIERPPNTRSTLPPKSSPTTATTRTSVKNEAAREKYVAAPPTTRDRLAERRLDRVESDRAHRKNGIPQVLPDDGRQVPLHLHPDIASGLVMIACASAEPHPQPRWAAAGRPPRRWRAAPSARSASAWRRSSPRSPNRDPDASSRSRSPGRASRSRSPPRAPASPPAGSSCR